MKEELGRILKPGTLANAEVTPLLVPVPPANATEITTEVWPSVKQSEYTTAPTLRDMGLPVKVREAVNAQENDLQDTLIRKNPRNGVES